MNNIFILFFRYKHLLNAPLKGSYELTSGLRDAFRKQFGTNKCTLLNISLL